jgi:hypothetical protein
MKLKRTTNRQTTLSACAALMVQLLKAIQSYFAMDVTLRFIRLATAFPRFLKETSIATVVRRSSGSPPSATIGVSTSPKMLFDARYVLCIMVA